MDFLSSVQFANIAALGFALAAPLLIFAYLHRDPSRRTIVSSLIIFKRLSQRPVFRRRVKLPLRFFLELTALLLLALAAATPVLRSRGEHVAVLIDNSLSMRMTDGRSIRFDEAVSAAEEWIVDQGWLNVYSLYVVSPKLARIGEEGQGRDAAVAQLKELKPAFTADAIEAAVGELLQSGDFDRVVVISDQEAELVDGDSALGADASKKRTTVEAKRVGRQAANIYLANLRIENTPSTAVVASVGISGNQPQEVEVQLSQRLGQQAGERRLATAPVKAEPERLTEARFPLIGAADQLLHVTIRPLRGGSNSLAEDDEGWVRAGKTGGTSVLVVNAAGSSALGLDALPGLDVQIVRAEAFPSLDEKLISRFSLIVFYRSAPASPPKVPTLLVLPPQENRLFPVARQAENAVVTSWKDEHPITAYLNTALMKPGPALIFNVPAWAQTVINAEQGSIIAAGESQGVRFAAVGIEILPFEGIATPTASVLTLNLLHWLTGGAEIGQEYLTGSTLRLEPAKRWSIIDPQGKEETVPAGAKELAFISLLTPGPYEVRGIDERSGQTAERIVTVNPFHVDESATFVRRSFRLPREVSTDVQVSEEQEPVWPLILGAVLVIMLLDMLLQLIQRPGDARISA